MRSSFYIIHENNNDNKVKFTVRLGSRLVGPCDILLPEGPSLG